MASTGPSGYNPDHALTPSTGPMLPSSMSIQAVVVSSVLGMVALIAFTVRLYAQRRMGNKTHPEDWAFTAGLVVVLGMCALMIYGACRAGVGWPVTLLMPVTVPFLRVLFSEQLLWSIAISLIRAGLLLFYRRIFTRRFQIGHTILLVINGAWVLTSIIVNLATYRWSATKQLKINYPAWLISMSSLDVAQDLAAVSLPLSAIRTLKVNRKRKVLLSAVFLLGLLCVAASGVRLKYFADLGELSVTSRETSAVTFHCILWCIIQACCSLTTACLIGWAPLFAEGQCLHWVVSGTRSFLSIVSHHSSSSNTNTKSSNSTPVRGYITIEKTVKWSVRPELDTGRLSNDSNPAASSSSTTTTTTEMELYSY